MKYYAVAEIDVTNPAWTRSYVENVTAMVEKRGGRYLARTTDVLRLEGARPARQLFLIIEWPSKEAAVAFYECEEYKPYLKGRLEGSEGEFTLVASDDINKRAQLT